MSQPRSPVRERILRVATRLMQVRGYHRTGLEDILRASGAGKGNFYHYFRSKEDLGYTILERLVREFTDRTLDPVFGDPRRTAIEQIEAFLEAIVGAQRARKCVGGCPMGNLATELADSHEGFRQRLVQAFDLWRDRVAGALARARAEGSLAPDVDPDGLARFIVAGLEGSILLAKVQKDIRVMETCVAELRRHLAFYRRAPVAAAPAAAVSGGDGA